MNLMLSLALLADGQGAYYNSGIMESTVAYRVELGQIQPCPDCIGAVALMDCRDLGRIVYLQWPDDTVDGRYLVADCAEAKHRANLIAMGRAVEYDFHAAERHAYLGALAGPVPVRVLWQPPQPSCPSAGKC